MSPDLLYDNPGQAMRAAMAAAKTDGIVQYVKVHAKPGNWAWCAYPCERIDKIVAGLRLTGYIVQWVGSTVYIYDADQPLSRNDQQRATMRKPSSEAGP